MDVYSCPICTQDVLDTHQAVTCNCDNDTWYHAKCALLTEEQYELLNQDQTKLTWVCTQCKSLSCRPTPKHTNQSKQFDEIIKILLDDITTLKEEVKALKTEKNGLSEIVAKKTEIIYRLESTILDLTKDSKLSPAPKNTPTSSKLKTKITPTQDNLTKKQYSTALLNSSNNKAQAENPTTLTANRECPLIIGDSLMRHTTNILKKQNPKVFLETNQIVMSGAKIQDVSNFLRNQNKLPKQVVIQAGSNNISRSKTPNHVMRPLWLTIESNQKRFPETEWYVGSIPYRDDCRKIFIEETNKALEFMCSQLKVHFINNTNILNDTHLSWDGIHLNQTGSEIQANQIIQALGLTTNDSFSPKLSNRHHTTPNSKTSSNPPVN